MPTPYCTTTTEAWLVAIPCEWWSILGSTVRTVQFATIEAAEAYLGVTLRSNEE